MLLPSVGMMKGVIRKILGFTTYWNSACEYVKSCEFMETVTTVNPALDAGTLHCVPSETLRPFVVVVPNLHER